MRKEVPSDRTKDVVEFSTKAPKERLASIRQAFSVRCFLRFILRYLFRLAMLGIILRCPFCSTYPCCSTVLVLFYDALFFYDACFLLRCTSHFAMPLSFYDAWD